MLGRTAWPRWAAAKSKVARMGSVAIFGQLPKFAGLFESQGAGQFLLPYLIPLDTPCCEQPRGQNHCRYQIDDRDARPHQRSGALLVFDSGNGEHSWRGEL